MSRQPCFLPAYLAQIAVSYVVNERLFGCLFETLINDHRRLVDAIQIDDFAVDDQLDVGGVNRSFSNLDFFRQTCVLLASGWSVYNDASLRYFLPKKKLGPLTRITGAPFVLTDSSVARVSRTSRGQ